MAMGSTKMLMRSRYSGNTHVAVLMWRSSTFSTTATCHWRGSKRIASIDSTISQSHEP